MIISDKQHEANRRNAQHSSGPTTPEGREAVRLNALTYGLRARTLLLPGEDAEEYKRLWDALVAEWQPQTPTERFYLETMSTSHWLLARTDSSEQRIRNADLRLDTQSALLDRIAKQRTRLERSYTSAMHELKQLQKERRARQPQPAQTAQPAKPAPAPAPPPDYVMSEGAADHSVFSAPATPDTR